MARFTDRLSQLPGRSRRGFSLVELLVSLAVLIVVIAVVSSVFAVTSNTSSISVALTTLEMQVNNLFDQLKADLDGVRPGESILVLYGRKQAAARTPDERVGNVRWRVQTGDPSTWDGDNPALSTTEPPSYSDPRADLLMFFTHRPQPSRAPSALPPGSLDAFQANLQRGGMVSPVQVAYGHAAISDVSELSGGGFSFGNLRHVDTIGSQGMSLLPLTQWQLARRAVLIEDVSTGQEVQSYGNPGETAFSTAEFDRIRRCYSDPAFAQFAGDSARFRYSDYLREFGPRPALGPSPQLPLKWPYGSLASPGVIAWSTSDLSLVSEVLFANGDATNLHIATVASNPPPGLSGNAGLAVLPGCAWFQVEFLLPEDPRNDPAHPMSTQRDDGQRWVAVPDGEVFVFVPDSDENRELIRSEVTPVGSPAGARLASFAQVVPPANGGADTADNRHIRLWPYAIRVTVRAFDPDGRLDEPLLRSFVHKFDP